MLRSQKIRILLFTLLWAASAFAPTSHAYAQGRQYFDFNVPLVVNGIYVSDVPVRVARDGTGIVNRDIFLQAAARALPRTLVQRLRDAVEPGQAQFSAFKQDDFVLLFDRRAFQLRAETRTDRVSTVPRPVIRPNALETGRLGRSPLGNEAIGQKGVTAPVQPAPPRSQTSPVLSQAASRVDGQREARPPTTQATESSTVPQNQAVEEPDEPRSDNLAPKFDPAVPLFGLTAPLTVNGVYVSDIAVQVAENGSGLVNRDTLLELLEPILMTPLIRRLREGVAEGDVEFGAFEQPDFALRFNVERFELNADVALSSSIENDVSLNPQRAPPNPNVFDEPALVSVGVNVAAQQDYVHEDDSGAETGSGPLTAAAEGYANVGGFDGVSLTFGADYREGAEDEITRRDVRIIKDDFERAIRYEVGEFAARSISFQDSPQVLGFSIARDYDTIRPFQNVRPVGRRELQLERQSVVDVEVNGVVVSSLELPPGRYRLEDFPLVSGANNVRLTVDDGLGEKEVIQFNLIFEPVLLDAGVFDFGVTAGLQEDVEAEGQYSGGIGSIYARYGLTGRATLGGSLQGGGDGFLTTTDITLATGLGFFGLEGGYSRVNDVFDEYQEGHASTIDFRSDFSIFDKSDTVLSLSGEYLSENFSTPFTKAVFNPTEYRLTADIRQQPFSGGSLGLSVNRVITRGDSPSSTEYNASVGFRLFATNINLSVARRALDYGDNETSGLISLTYSPFSRGRVSTRYSTESEETVIDFARTSRTAVGDVSGRVSLTSNEDDNSAEGELQYINNRFEAQLSHNVQTMSGREFDERRQASRYNIQSFLGFANGRVAIGRPSPANFIIASRHPTLSKSRVSFLDGGGNVQAQSGMFGPAVIPVGRSYAENIFEVDVEPLPPGYDLGSGLLETFPGALHGYAFRVGSDASRSVLGSFIREDGTPLGLRVGEVRSATLKEAKPFFTNTSGRFFVDSLSPGRYEIYIGDMRVLEFTIPEAAEGVLNVGQTTIRGDL